MKIYIYKDSYPATESAQESKPQTVTINRGNGGMPIILHASEVLIVDKEDLEVILSKPRLVATATGVVTTKEELAGEEENQKIKAHS